MVLRGRDAELGRLVAHLHEALAGRAGGIVVRGDAGIGKTQLIKEGVAQVGRPAGRDVDPRSPGPRMLWVQGNETEMPQPFAALGRLLRPLLSTTDELAPTHADGARTVLGHDDDPTVDRFSVFAAALSTPTVAAEHEPLLVVVDDAHWLDAESAAALLFVARRVIVDPLAMIFAARPGPGRFDVLDVTELALGGLTDADAQAVLSDHTDGAVDEGLRAQLVEVAGGNPLALLELPRALRAHQLPGDLRATDRLPLTEALERALLDRVRALPAEAQLLLLLAAVDDTRQRGTVVSAGRRLGLDRSSLDAAIGSSLLRLDGTELRWHHPLVRSAVYGAAAGADRARAHRALAESHAADGDLDRSALHRAAVADAPDDELADALVAAADHASRRGGHAAASAMSARAAELSTRAEVRAARFLTAAWSAWSGGQIDRARAFSAEGLGFARDPTVIADLVGLRARLEWNAGSADAATRMLMDTSRQIAGIDVARSFETAMVASVLITFGAKEPAADAFDELPVVSATTEPRWQCLAHLTAGHRHLAAHRWAAAVNELEASDRIGADLVDDLDIQSNLALSAFHLGADDRSEARYRNLLAGARSSGRLSMMVHALARLPAAQLPTGQWDAAAASAAEAISLAADAGEPYMLALPLAWQAVITAGRGGDTDDAVSRLRQLRVRTPVGIAAYVCDDLLRWARGVHATRMGRPDTAFHHLQQIALPVIQRLIADDRLDAAAAAGQHAVAIRWIREIDDFGRATGAGWARASAELGRALVTAETNGNAEPHYTSSLSWHARSRRPVGRARTQLAYGTFLRRAGRRVDARTQLRAALLVFDDIGAEPWSSRAVAELRASGESVKGARHTAVALTPQEHQTAQLVCEGLSNRQIAEKLFLSRRTVEYHLSHVYQKYGVSSRGSLTHLLASGRSEPVRP